MCNASHRPLAARIWALAILIAVSLLSAPRLFATSGTLEFTFQDIAQVKTLAAVGWNQLDFRLVVPPGQSAPVVTGAPGSPWEWVGPPEAPTSLTQFWLTSSDPVYRAEFLDLIRQCERKALLVQADPDRYSLRLWVWVHNEAFVTEVWPGVIYIKMPKAMLGCYLERV